MATVELPLLASPPPGESKGFYEIVNGERREIASMGSMACLIATSLACTLGTFVRDKHLGLMFVEGLFVLREKPRLRRQPDIAFVAYDRLPEPLFPPETDPAAFNAVPNLAVEVISPTDLVGELVEKIRHYFEAGVQCVWVIYPLDRTIHVFDSRTKVRIMTEEDELDGGAVLPGFRLPVATLFQTPTRPK